VVSELLLGCAYYLLIRGYGFGGCWVLAGWFKMLLSVTFIFPLIHEFAALGVHD
jgi:hypothetical protein